MSEHKAYGNSCGCICRRRFVLVSCLVLMVLCYAQLLRWLVQAQLLDPRGLHEKKQDPKSCTGTQCYEVFSCYGMKEATYHFREPFITVGGAVALPLGLWGAHQGSRWHMQVAATYLATNALLRLCIMIADVAYFRACDAYSDNVVDQILLQTKGLVYQGAQEQLATLTSFSVERVDAITGALNALAFYLASAGAWLLVIGYLAREAHQLVQLLERGPLGLGMHYGLDRWDEAIQWDDIAKTRLAKESMAESQFLNDARLPDNKTQDLAPGFSVSRWSRGYGAA